MARDDPHFRLRLPAELKEKIEFSAKENNRSINAEILSRLENSFSVQVDISIPNKSPDLLRAIEQFAGTVAMEALKAAGYRVNEFSPKDRDDIGKAFVKKSNDQGKAGSGEEK